HAASRRVPYRRRAGIDCGLQTLIAGQVAEGDVAVRTDDAGGRRGEDTEGGDGAHGEAAGVEEGDEVARAAVAGSQGAADAVVSHVQSHIASGTHAEVAAGTTRRSAVLHAASRR